jgi:hypothetical protein
MILTATLLTLRDITLLQQRDISILYQPTIGQGDGIKVSNPTSEFKLWLSGEAGYVVVWKDVGESESQKPLLQVMSYFRFSAPSAPSASPSGSRAVLFLPYLFYLCVFMCFFIVFLEPEAWRRSVARHPRLQVIAYS